MARNEEKQQGKLNRLWLQKEREEGRIKDIHERRPKLATLNSASAVKKWIPSIKREIEYYLQQSQLSHYPERKIAEFQFCIEGLEKEYKRFLSKLRALDPSCKHQPWTPRAYAKKREDPLRSVGYGHGSTPRAEGDCEGAHDRTGSDNTLAHEKEDRQSESRYSVVAASADPSPLASESGHADQDQPLSFDRTRLAVALAGCRGPVELGSSQTPSIARVLLSGLPNLHSSPLGRAIAQARGPGSPGRAGERGGRRGGGRGSVMDCVSAGEGRTRRNAVETEDRMGHVLGLDVETGDRTGHVLGLDVETGDRTGHVLGLDVETGDSMGHVLGLACYSSSDEESAT
ncbi:uncharacterized protein si:dkey-86e18.1 isoform X2 [Hypomesus transpacificus]|uniref:uncharacterized protein si:dkey-86e18.1 isoform X2 n=1 Tax=Hypomesus transpacificus TaxID=137520 RepID=UPI001F07F599|nr:uncharacterized protein si:dkey-86e18.1 isoform X2 [Hypomesus transpacificus]